ncbi:hypothetical protein [Aureitalea marina]|uniref:Uncharacterized protein n=1 Tax=Aureitalea marina TaxID=930804 RepID=A0A2S7KN49_9FLAO|nr:hypothetical protein [Aureitalea marina]PQB04059.1 hypothetical protein BST85_03440 [Aureitalea marina]
MFHKTDVEIELKRNRDRRLTEDEILMQVEHLLAELDEDRQHIEQRLRSASDESNQEIDLSILDPRRVYSLEDIKRTCIDYRLRFLESRYFKGDFPEETVSKIRQMENEQGMQLSGFKIMAPSKRLLLENADDPLLFLPIGKDQYYLIDKWGNDLHPMRKWLMWPYKNFENLILTIFLLSMVLTWITPVHLFHPEPGMQEYVLMFLFMFKSVGGVVLYYGFAKGKNFNNAIWDSKYYNA